MRIFIVLFTFTVIHLRWAYDDYEYNRDVRLFYTFGRQFGNLAEFQRQRSLMGAHRRNPWSESNFDMPELNFGDYIKKGGDKNQCSCGCGKANIEKKKWAEGGEEVKPPYKYPWMTAFKRRGKDGVFCGGALITETFVLTAAHCLDRNPESSHKGVKSRLQPWKPSELNLHFVTNTRNLQAAPPVQQIIPHPGFDFKNIDHDIGLVKLSKPVPYTKYTRPICLAPQGIPVNIGKIFQIAGWGVEEVASGKGSKALLEAKIQHVPFSKCEHKFKRHLKKNYYCLKGLEGQSPCHGDSGGPMFREYEGAYYVIGVTSMHSSNDCDPDDTFIYTSVSSHIPWIKSVLGGEFPTGQQSSSSNRASSTGQRASSSSWASPFGPKALSYTRIITNGDWPAPPFYAGQQPSSSKWASSAGQGSSFHNSAHSSGQQLSSSKWEHSTGQGASSSNRAHSTGQGASSSNWAYSTGQRPSYSSWSYSSGQWSSS